MCELLGAKKHRARISGGYPMALQPGSFFESDASGTPETLTLKPVAPATSTNAMIANAFYGVDASSAPKPVVIAADGMSFDITVLSGINSLVVNFVSPNPRDELISLCQGLTVIARPTVRNHSAVSTLFIRGT
jgi:hypothetical protein